MCCLFECEAPGQKIIGRIFWHGLSLCTVRSVCWGLLVTVYVPSWHVLPAVTRHLHAVAISCDRKGRYCGVWRWMKHLNAKESHQVMEAQASLASCPLCDGVGGAVSGTPLHQLNASLSPSCSGDRAELCTRAVLQGLLSTQKSNGQYGQVSVSMEHAHQKCTTFAKISTVLLPGGFPWFPPKRRRFKYIYFYIWIYIFHIHNLTSS